MNRFIQTCGRKGACLLAFIGTLVLLAPQPGLAQNLNPARLITASGVASPITLNILIGKYLGYYEKEGLRFELGTMGVTGTGPIIQGITQGRFEFGTVDATTLLSLDVQGNDVPLKAFYVYTREHPEVMAVPAGSPIKALNQLKGKKIGVRSIARSRYARAILATAGVDSKSVTYLPVGIGAGPAIALRRGEVQALSLFDVDMARVESLGVKLHYLPLPEDWHKIQGPLLITSDKMIQEHPDRVIGFARAVAKGTLFALTNPEAAVKIFYKMYPEALPKGRTREQSIKNTLFILKARLAKLTINNRKVKKWGYIDPESWRLSEELLGYKGKVHKPLSSFYTNRFMDAINQFNQQEIITQAKSYKID